MSRRNNGSAYESMVLSVYEALCRDERLSTVKHNVKLPGPEGERQIDVMVSHVHAGVEYLTVIECRDYSGKLDVTQIDGFASKICDVKANKGIMVSRKGFSKTAIQKANRLGVGLCTVDTADCLLKEMVVEIPILVVTVEPELDVKVLFKSEKATKVSEEKLSTINDVALRDLVLSELRDGVIGIPDETTTISWVPKQLAPPFNIRDFNDEKIQIEWFAVNLTLRISYYFGRTNDLPDLISHVTLGEKTARIIVPDKFRIQLNESFNKYRHRSEVPPCASEAILGIVAPQVGDKPVATHRAFRVSSDPSVHQALRYKAAQREWPPR